MAAEIDKAAAAVREQLLAGRVPMEVFGKAVGLGPRALYGCMAEGLPFRRVGSHRYIEPNEAAAWLDRRAARRKITKVVAPDAPRPVGRPRNALSSTSR